MIYGDYVRILGLEDNKAPMYTVYHVPVPKLYQYVFRVLMHTDHSNKNFQHYTIHLPAQLSKLVDATPSTLVSQSCRGAAGG